MRLFISGELDISKYKDLGNDFRRVTRPVEKKIQTEILDKNNYGDALNGLGIIPVIYSKDMLKTAEDGGTPIKERKLYMPSKKDSDYRLFIDHDKFVNTDDKGKEKLILENIIKCVQLLGEKIKQGFDAKKLETDIRELFGSTLS